MAKKFSELHLLLQKKFSFEKMSIFSRNKTVSRASDPHIQVGKKGQTSFFMSGKRKQTKGGF